MVAQLIAEGFLLLSSLVILTSTLGVFRFSDFISKFHAAGLIESFSLPLALIGCSVGIFPSFFILKFVLLLIILWINSPLVCYVLVRSYL